MLHVICSIACSVGFWFFALSVSVFRHGGVRINLALGTFFTRKRLSDYIRLVIVVCNPAFGVDFATAVPEVQVTRLSVEVNGLLVDLSLGHICRTRK